ncbi:MAG: hypothetical protein Kow0096_13120 [Thiohalomonadaceae bacterium]
MTKKKYIFVGGCPRSGTTLLKRILDAHTQIYCGPEFGHLAPLCERYRVMKRGVDADRLSAYFDHEALRGIYGEFIDRLLSSHLTENNVTYIAEKTPDNVMVFAELHELFPDARFVEIVRHPLDVIASYKRVSQRAGEGLKKNKDSALVAVDNAARKWVSSVGSVAGSPAAGRPEFMSHYMRIRYEDLVSKPRDIVQTLVTFLDLPFEDGMLDTERDLKGDAVSFGGVFYTESEYKSGISASRIATWEQELTDDELRIVLPIVIPAAVELGYVEPRQFRKYLK